MTVRLPLDATVQRTTVGGSAVLDITPSQGRWSIRISAPRSGPGAEGEVPAAMDRALMDLARRTGVIRDASTKRDVAALVRVLEPAVGTPRVIRLPATDAPAERVLVEVPGSAGASDAPAANIQGIVLLKPQADRFALLELFAPVDERAAAQRAFDAVVGSANFMQAELASADRQKVIATGEALRGAWAATDYLAALKADPEWFRLYTPAKEAADEAEATEHGYRTVRGWAGKRSELGGGALGADDPEGYLVEVLARVIIPTGGEERAWTITDTKARYFLSADRREEAWTVTVSMRDSRASKGKVYAELGARSGESLTVEVSQPGKPARQVRSRIPPAGYLSQLETMVLPRLLVRGGAEADAGFYAYRSDAEAITLRRDVLRHDEAGWTLTTTFREGDPPQSSLLTSDGGIRSTRLADERVWTPTDPAKLMQIWKAKGLPTG